MAERRVRDWLRRRAERGERTVFLLVDPEKPIEADTVARLLGEGADAVLIGGTLNVTPYDVDEYIAKLRRRGVKSYIIIFPGGVNNIGRLADAIFFMALFNTVDPYWLVGAQLAAAPIIKRYGLEPIPTAYVIYGYGGAAGHMGRALPIPWETPYLTAAYALAAEMLGIKHVYIEAGSGSPKPVPPEAVAAARKAVEDDTFITVGGGIRSPEAARMLAEAGANAIVLGTIVEKNPERAEEIIEAFKEA